MTKEQLKAYKDIYPGLTDEQWEAVHHLVETTKEAVSVMMEGFRRFAGALTPVAKDIAQYLTDQAELERCPNRRVVHLANHARRVRTRKKNLHRAMRIIEKEGDK